MISFLLLANALATPTIIPVFSPDSQHPCYRQPAITTTNDAGDHVLVFAEWREVSVCAPPNDVRLSPRGPNEVGGLVTRLSIDGGQTFQAARTVYLGNIDYYAVVRDSARNTLWLFLQALSQTLLFRSTDEGDTWSKPVVFNTTMPPNFPQPIPAVGHGVEIDATLCAPACEQAGRLVVPFVCTNTTERHDNGSCKGCHSCAVYSDDHGATWHLGGLGQQGTRESEVVQTASATRSASLYATERNFITPGHRLAARSMDAGTTYGNFSNTTLVEPVTKDWTGIVSGITRLPVESSGRVDNSRIVYCSASNPTVRADMTIFESRDEAVSWRPGTVLWPGLAGYCDIVGMGTRGTAAIVFESGTASFADHITFSVLPYEWIDGDK